MNDNQFQALIDLVNFDQKTIALLKNIEQIQKEISNLRDNQQELDLELSKARFELKELQKNVDQGELEMKELDQEEMDKKKRLEQSKNQKEYLSLQKEIDAIHKKQHDLEEPLLSTWNKLENAKQEFNIKESRYNKKEEEIKQSITNKEKELIDIQVELEKHKKHRVEKEKFVKTELLEKYSVMRQQVANPVVSVENGSCSACFYNVTNQQMLELKRNKIVQCRGCYRFLYLKKESK